MKLIKKGNNREVSKTTANAGARGTITCRGFCQEIIVED